MISQVNRPPGIRERYEAILKLIAEGKSYRQLKVRFGKKLLNDLAANACNFPSIYKKLGLAWVQSGQTVTITSTGERYLEADKEAELQVIFERQVLKWQLYNPTLPSRYKPLRIFPLIFLLQVLLKVKPAQLTKVEYVLFITKAQSMGEVDGVVEQISDWRRLGTVKQNEIIEHLLKPQPGRRRPLYLELLDSANKEIAFFGLTSPLRARSIDGTLRIELVDRRRALKFVKLKGRSPIFIEFESELDWFSY